MPQPPRPPTDTTDYAELVEFLATGGRIDDANSWSRQPAAPGRVPAWSERARKAAQEELARVASDPRKPS